MQRTPTGRVQQVRQLVARSMTTSGAAAEQLLPTPPDNVLAIDI